MRGPSLRQGGRDSRELTGRMRGGWMKAVAFIITKSDTAEALFWWNFIPCGNWRIQSASNKFQNKAILIPCVSITLRYLCMWFMSVIRCYLLCLVSYLLFIIQYSINGIYYWIKAASYFQAMYGTVQEVSVSNKFSGFYFEVTCFKSGPEYQL